MPRGVAERLARCLTPMRDRLTLAGAEAAIPYPVRFLDLVGMGMPAPEQVLAHWVGNFEALWQERFDQLDTVVAELKSESEGDDGDANHRHG